MSNAIGYIRISTQGQAEDRISLTMQRQKIEANCSLHDLDLAESFVMTARVPSHSIALVSRGSWPWLMRVRRRR